MKFIIVRHGQTLWNAEKRFQGKTDTKLSKKGIKQAKMLAKKLSGKNIDVIYTSSLKRTVATAKEMLKFHKKAKIIKAKELDELLWGIWEGIKLSEVKKIYPELYKKRENDRFNFKIPKGESLRMLQSRVKKFLHRIMPKSKHKSVLIVSHLNVSRVLIGILMGLKGKKAASLNLDNASVIEITIDNKKTMSGNIKNGNSPC